MLKYILPIFLSFALAVPGLAQGYVGPGGTPGGTSGQQQYNNSGVLGGFTMSGDMTVNTGTGVATGSAALKAGAVGGDGSGGALNLSATESTIMQYNGTTVSVADGATETLISGSVINATSTITIGGGASGIMKVAGIAVGAASGSGSGGAATGNGSQGCGGPTIAIGGSTLQTLGGAAGAYTLGGGGGGGGGGWAASSAGGASGGGGAAGAARTTGFSTSTVYNGTIIPGFICGAQGGGGGGGQGSSNAAKLGGASVGKITLCAVGGITVAAGGSLNANGGAGDASVTPDATGHAGGGAGGGPAGVLTAYSLTSITATGTISSNGGAGGNGGAAKAATNGNGGGGGGGGGPGIVLRMSPSNGGAGTYQAIGGAGGNAGAKDGAGTIGVAGTSNTGTTGLALSLTGTPNFPLIVMHNKYLIGSFGQLCELRKDANGNYNADMREHTSMMAAIETSQRWNDGICFVDKTPIHGQINEQANVPANVAFAQMQHHFMTSTEWVPNNAVAILNDPSKVQAKLDDFTCETLTNPEQGLYCGGLGEIAGDQV